jgi:hypothetical protein
LARNSCTAALSFSGSGALFENETIKLPYGRHHIQNLAHDCFVKRKLLLWQLFYGKGIMIFSYELLSALSDESQHLIASPTRFSKIPSHERREKEERKY